MLRSAPAHINTKGGRRSHPFPSPSGPARERILDVDTHMGTRIDPRARARARRKLLIRGSRGGEEKDRGRAPIDLSRQISRTRATLASYKSATAPRRSAHLRVHPRARARIPRGIRRRQTPWRGKDARGGREENPMARDAIINRRRRATDVALSASIFHFSPPRPRARGSNAVTSVFPVSGHVYFARRSSRTRTSA